MGLFDIFKKKQKALPQPAQVMQRDEENVEIFGVNYINSFRHRDKVETNLYIARMSRVEETIFPERADYVAFETPKEINLNDQIMEMVKNRYERESRGRETNNNQYYFGRLQQIGQELYFGNKSNAVNSYVSKTIDNEINAKIMENQRRKEESQREQEEQYRKKQFKNELDVKRYLQGRDYERMMRKSHPELKMEWKPKNRSKNDYSGININTGEILRIMETSKIGKDENGTYLYTARIYNTDNREDADMFDVGYNVCFELYKRLEDIVQSNNQEEIVKVLELLSDEKNFQDINRLKYIGKLDEYGQISKEQTSRSIPIAEKISQLQQKFDMERNQGQQGRGF